MPTLSSAQQLQQRREMAEAKRKTEEEAKQNFAAQEPFSKGAAMISDKYRELFSNVGQTTFIPEKLPSLIKTTDWIDLYVDKAFQFTGKLTEPWLIESVELGLRLRGVLFLKLYLDTKNPELLNKFFEIEERRFAFMNDNVKDVARAKDIAGILRDRYQEYFNQTGIPEYQNKARFYEGICRPTTGLSH